MALQVTGGGLRGGRGQIPGCVRGPVSWVLGKLSAILTPTQWLGALTRRPTSSLTSTACARPCRPLGAAQVSPHPARAGRPLHCHPPVFRDEQVSFDVMAGLVGNRAPLLACLLGFLRTAGVLSTGLACAPRSWETPVLCPRPSNAHLEAAGRGSSFRLSAAFFVPFPQHSWGSAIYKKTKPGPAKGSRSTWPHPGGPHVCASLLGAVRAAGPAPPRP